MLESMPMEVHPIPEAKLQEITRELKFQFSAWQINYTSKLLSHPTLGML
jgi:hypothetical protein